MKEKEKENPHDDEFVKQEEPYLFNPHGAIASTAPRAEQSQLINTVCVMLLCQGI